MASVGGVLLQHKLSFFAVIDSIQGGLWMGAPIPTHLHVGQGLPTDGSQQLMERDEFICQVRGSSSKHRIITSCSTIAITGNLNSISGIGYGCDSSTVLWPRSMLLDVANWVLSSTDCFRCTNASVMLPTSFCYWLAPSFMKHFMLACSRSFMVKHPLDLECYRLFSTDTSARSRRGDQRQGGARPA
jgi:hypothetical protein